MDRVFFTTKFAVEDTGAVACMAWAWGKPDRVGDVIEKSAFGAIDLPLPMLAFHDLKSPIGAWHQAEGRDDGLHLSGKMEIEHVALAREVHALVKSGGVRRVSIGFRTIKATPRRGGGRIISRAELIECSAVPVGMHPDARITSAKSVAQALRIAESINRAAAQMKGN